jgi:hypothetical protein
MMASSTNLSGFKNRGGKLIIVQGVSDPVFSLQNTIDWWNEVDKVNGGRLSDFMRLFGVPGMNHCSGGPATDQFDAFTALVNWVEKNTPPASITATAGPASPWPNRTRPLCPYPEQARYKGSGSIEDAANFSCRRPSSGQALFHKTRNIKSPLVLARLGQIVCGLHPQPHVRAPSQGLFEPERQLGADRRLALRHLVELAARNSHGLRGRRDTQVQRLEVRFRELTRMNWILHRHV